mmetsp:Transcript_74603/g.230458  ORF Transcript_74603/g.230458 Transcript_74603/m.230458 type:complete len:288 (-) Transcript_74603:510-1373(-)
MLSTPTCLSTRTSTVILTGSLPCCSTHRASGTSSTCELFGTATESRRGRHGSCRPIPLASSAPTLARSHAATRKPLLEREFVRKILCASRYATTRSWSSGLRACRAASDSASKAPRATMPSSVRRRSLSRVAGWSAASASRGPASGPRDAAAPPAASSSLSEPLPPPPAPARAAPRSSPRRGERLPRAGSPRRPTPLGGGVGGGPEAGDPHATPPCCLCCCRCCCCCCRCCRRRCCCCWRSSQSWHRCPWSRLPRCPPLQWRRSSMARSSLSWSSLPRSSLPWSSLA